MNETGIVLKKDFVEKDGVYWMTSERLGERLGFVNPGIAINKIYRRNEEELRHFTCETKMVYQHGAKYSRIFNEQGCYIVAMLAKTAQAREFRRALAQFLEDIRKRLVPRDEYERTRAKLAGHEIRYFLRHSQIDRQSFEDIIAYYYRHNLIYEEISKLVGATSKMIERVLHLYRMTVSADELPEHIHRTGRPMGVNRGTHLYKQALLPGFRPVGIRSAE